MRKIIRNTATPEGRAFWESAKRIAAQADGWPDSRRAGINVSQFRVGNASDDDFEPEIVARPVPAPPSPYEGRKELEWHLEVEEREQWMVFG